MSEEDKKLAEAIAPLPFWHKVWLAAFAELKLAEIDLEIAEEEQLKAEAIFLKATKKLNEANYDRD